MTKRSVLNIGIIGSILLFFPAIWSQFSSCYQSDLFFCKDSYGMIATSVLPLLPILIFSIITYKMRDEVFRAWWGFAWWWTLIIIAVTIFLQNAGGGGGLGIGGAVSGAFDALVLGILYATLVLVSLIKIVRTSLKLRTS